MGKIVVLSFIAGDCEQGFQHVSLEIKEDNHRPLKKIDGNLPSAPQIPQLYNTWQSKYRQMGSRGRIEPKSGQVTNYSICDLEADSDALRQQLNDWLTSPGFSRAINILGMTVSQNEEVRVIIQTEDLNLRRLPWHLWEFFDHYQKAQVALSSTAYQQIDSQRNRNQVRVLAIIGDSTGINLERDKRELERNLPNAEIVFVTQPERREVYDAIWDARGWDILFFAGHSLSASDATTGKLFIKQGESLEVKDMKAALRKAIGRGLKLAIFNSCDGLGIAKQLAELNIPQVIVMREPVPDVVAQEFLKRFLEAFAGGESLYLAVREARERLEIVQREFPCATWLPVLCQNPAEEPVSWLELVGREQSKIEVQDTPVIPRENCEKLVNLGQWLENIIEADWQVVTEILDTKSLLPLESRRSGSFEGVIRAKSIEFPIKPTSIYLALVVVVTQGSSQQRQIKLQLYPLEKTSFPLGLKSVALDTFGKTICEVQPNNADPWMQLDIQGEPGEQFRLKVELGTASITKDFII